MKPEESSRRHRIHSDAPHVERGYYPLKIVIFAGVFDPVHKGHISAAEQALHYGSKVVFLPEKTPQHKHGTAEYKHRLRMLEIATADNSRLLVMDYPKERQYIRETFDWLKVQLPDSKFVWLVGSDVTPMIETWPDSKELRDLEVVSIVEIQRESKTTTYIGDIHGMRVIPLKRPRHEHEDINSSSIRADLQLKHTMLPDGVHSYIIVHGLYSADVSDSEK